MRLAAAVLAAAVALPACASAARPAALGAAPTAAEGSWYSGTPSGRMDYDRMGPYVALSLIQSMEDFDTGGTGVSADDADPGVGIKGGLRLDPNLSVELALESVAGYQVSAGAAELDLDFTNVVVQGKYYLLTHRVQPFVFAGFGWTDAEADLSVPFFSGASISDSETGTFFRVGAGADVYLTPAFAVFGEASYNRMMGDLKDLDHFDAVIGILFRF